MNKIPAVVCGNCRIRNKMLQNPCREKVLIYLKIVVDFGPNSNAIHDAMVQAGFVWGGSFHTPDARHYQSQPAGTSPSAAQVQEYIGRGH